MFEKEVYNEVINNDEQAESVEFALKKIIKRVKKKELSYRVIIKEITQ